MFKSNFQIIYEVHQVYWLFYSILEIVSLQTLVRETERAEQAYPRVIPSLSLALKQEFNPSDKIRQKTKYFFLRPRQ